MNSAIGYEEWKVVSGYDGIYLISNFGNVYSYKKMRLLTHYFRTGYPSVCLCKGKVENHTLVHRLVAEHFIPNPDNKPEVNHKDGIRNNPHVDNLEWVTHSENIRHADMTGLRRVKGEDSKQAKLTNDAVREIRSMKGIMTQRALAKKFNVPHSLIHLVQHKKAWAHVI